MTANSSAVRPKAPLRRVGHYELLDVLGRGGMGVVYRARDLLLDRLVALKCPLVREPIDPELRERLFREGRAAARLWHPHIVPVFEVFEEDGVPWLAMQLVSGETLRGVIQAQERSRRRGRSAMPGSSRQRSTPPTAPECCTATSSPAT